MKLGIEIKKPSPRRLSIEFTLFGLRVWLIFGKVA
jgi:hypothetical protein